MVGLIVTGHGHFATGLTSSIDLIAGPQENYVAVDFDGNGTDKLEADLKAAFETLKDCEGILVFSDLAGGSPFRTAALVSAGIPNVKVLAGTNLPMLCEIAMGRTFINDVEMLVSSALATGKDGVQEFVMPTIDDGPADGEDGI
ncbi:MAG: PTS galactosamine/N-acetylgalactosamine transporter subunit IIA [Erysipelotrichaceae bacterium]|nr:PTS galactosamine/N-acetylgalactosamine transporter subunit IIA [Erysipelotrichaceae bacterium]